MNIQVCCPYQKCVFNCPMCIARGHKHKYNFADITYSEKYFTELKKVIENERECDVVLTGECDPSQNMRWVNNVLEHLKNVYFIGNIELQTRNYSLNIYELDLNELDVLSYSVVYARDYLRSYKFKKLTCGITRMVVLLTKEFEFLNKDVFSTMGFKQITFKTLNYGEDETINKWIDENRMSEEGVNRIREIIEKYSGDPTCSIRLDTSCQDATNRYYIFRSDGKLYTNWNAKTDRFSHKIKKLNGVFQEL